MFSALSLSDKMPLVSRCPWMCTARLSILISGHRAGPARRRDTSAGVSRAQECGQETPVCHQEIAETTCEIRDRRVGQTLSGLQYWYRGAFTTAKWRHLTFNLQLEDEICYTTLIIKNSLHSNALVLLDLISNYGTVLIYKFLKKDSYPVTFVNRLVISRLSSDTKQEPGEVEEHHNDSRGRGGTQWGWVIKVKSVLSLYGLPWPTLKLGNEKSWAQ